MTCIRIVHGWICGPDITCIYLDLGYRQVRLEWHHYHGPTFWVDARRGITDGRQLFVSHDDPNITDKDMDYIITEPMWDLFEEVTRRGWLTR